MLNLIEIALPIAILLFATLAYWESKKRAAELRKLRTLSAAAMPWIGEAADGPAWATDDARRRNRESAVKAFDDLDAYFQALPDGELPKNVLRRNNAISIGGGTC